MARATALKDLRALIAVLRLKCAPIGATIMENVTMVYASATKDGAALIVVIGIALQAAALRMVTASTVHVSVALDTEERIVDH